MMFVFAFISFFCCLGGLTSRNHWYNLSQNVLPIFFARNILEFCGAMSLSPFKLFCVYFVYVVGLCFVLSYFCKQAKSLLQVSR